MRLIDTNIIVYAHNADSPFQNTAMSIISDAITGKFEGCLSTQNLIEFYSIITHSKRVQKPLAAEQATTIVQYYIANPKTKILIPSLNSYAMAFALAQEHKVNGAEVFDTLLVATMLENNIRTIYTGNIRHFDRFPDVKAINPFFRE